MRDKINKTDAKLNIESIKGHVQIDLHDTRTGFNERIEKDNLVTDAIYNMQPFILGSPASYYLPIATKALGGIMLFDNAIEEKKENIWLPSDSHLVGFAGDSSQSISFLGSYNTEESGVIENGYTSVWDFTTNQCNGQIGAVARTTSSIVDVIGKQVNQNTYLGSNITVARSNSSRYLIPIAYDEKNKMLYMYDEYDGKKIVKAYWQKNKYRITDEYQWTIPESEIEEVTSLNIYWWRSFVANDGYVYYVESNFVNNKISIVRLKTSDFSFSAESKEFDLSSLSLNFTYSCIVCVTGGFIYFRTQDGTRFFRIEWDNTANIEEIKIDGYTLEQNVGMRSYHNGVELIRCRNGSDIGLGFLYPDGTVKVFNAPGIIAPGSSSDYRECFQLNDGSFFRNTNGRVLYNIYHDYLGTIANVGPFQKNSTQTMKITYSLTNE